MIAARSALLWILLMTAVPLLGCRAGEAPHAAIPLAAVPAPTHASTATGTVTCWGSDVLNDPVALKGLSSGVVAVSAGNDHTCAVTSTGAAMCFGANAHGQLGNDATTDSPAPVAVKGLSSGVVAVSAGHDHTCAVTSTGAVMCWGDNSHGQLGNDATTDSSAPVAVKGLSSGVVAVSAGYDHTCAVTASGAVMCWGDNSFGELGHSNAMKESHVPVAVKGISSGVVAVSAIAWHACALTSTGAVTCWGRNNDGQLGDTTTTDSHVPVAVKGLSSGVVAISASLSHTCAVTSTGTVTCWGDFGDDQAHPVPVAVKGLPSNVVAVSVGGTSTCSLTATGAATCWPSRYHGDLSKSFSTTAVPGLSSGVVAVTAGGAHACALTSTGAVMCWGGDYENQLETIDASSDVVAISEAGTHACALTSTGALECWGISPGLRGDKDATARLDRVPTTVTGLSSGVVAVSASESETCAVLSTGAVKCWGLNFGSTDKITMSEGPVEVSGLSSGVIAVSAGRWGACAVISTGAVKCWGFNFGQLGNNTRPETPALIPVPVPVEVTGLSFGVVAISASSGHTCALASSGAVTCWGFNSGGELGNATTTESLVPVAVKGLSSGVVAISAGVSHTCAVTSTGAVKCWGDNSHGQLGKNNDTGVHPTPVDVMSLSSGVVAISAGGSRTCAVVSIR